MKKILTITILLFLFSCERGYVCRSYGKQNNRQYSVSKTFKVFGTKKDVKLTVEKEDSIWTSHQITDIETNCVKGNLP